MTGSRKTLSESEKVQLSFSESRLIDVHYYLFCFLKGSIEPLSKDMPEVTTGETCVEYHCTVVKYFFCCLEIQFVQMFCHVL